ncbi:MAG TPA: hypothetical protein VGO46_03495 [Gemmatimonadaceae bacterium]|nr:hypothetical protein [Gemmatimonadaceae bacterium]
MLRTIRYTTLVVSLFALTAATKPAHAKWPPWLSIEAPVNPFDGSLRGVVCLVHAATHEGAPDISALSGTAEGLVGGARRSIPLKLDATSSAGVFAVRKQWPSDGAWVLKISLSSTTAIVALDRNDNVARVQIPTMLAEGRPIPRAVMARDIDSTLSVASVH